MPPRLARLLALIAALVLVGGAFAVRGALSGDEDDGGGDEGGRGPSGPLRVLCDADLGAVCDLVLALEGVDSAGSDVMRATDALEALDADTPPFDVWLTLDPWPAMADVERQGSDRPALAGEVVPVASSGLSVLTRSDGGLGCPAPAAWECVTTAAGAGPVATPSLATALGPLVLAHAAAGLVGDTDFGIGAVADTDRATALTQLLDSAPPDPTSTQALRFVTALGSYLAVVTTTGLAEANAASPAGAGIGAEARAVAAAPTVGVVLAALGPESDGLAPLEAALEDQTGRDALAEAGYAGDPARSAGLPDPDVIYALRTELG